MMGFFGIASVLMFDIATFLFAVDVMFFIIRIPQGSEPEEEDGMFDGFFGGALSEYLFEPFVNSGTKFSSAIVRLLGNTAGTGMAIMFLCTGITGFASCMFLSRSTRVKELSILVEQDESRAA